MTKEHILVGSLAFIVGSITGVLYMGNKPVMDHGTTETMSDTDHQQHDMTFHAHTPHEAEDPIPTVALKVIKDPKAGYNAEIITTNFTFKPESASQDYVAGEGHAHIYVDGVKLNRVYGNWYYLGELAKGERQITVSLSGNDHSELTHRGQPIASTVTLMVE